MLISEAFAQSSGGAKGAPDFSFLIMIALLFVVMYFFMIRPQQRRVKEHKALVSSLKRNDKVLTNGGIYGKVVKAGDGPEVEIEIAPDVKVKIDRNAVQTVIGKTPPPGAANKEAPVSPLKRLFGGR